MVTAIEKKFMRPYFYKIRNKQTGECYVGSQYGKNADSSNLLKTYFTSSKLVEERGYENFEIVYVKERQDARSYESKYLKKAYNMLGKTRFCQLLLNRNIAPGILNTPESIEKANKKRKISNSRSAKKLIESGRHNFSKFLNNPDLNPANRTDVKIKKSEKMKTIRKNRFWSRDMTPELKAKLSESSKGNTNVRGTIWVVNSDGLKKRVQPNNIPEGFQIGTKYKGNNNESN
jgi:hypothetical protein